MFNRFYRMSTPAFILTIIGLIILGLALSLVLFTFGYWLITLILLAFFSYTLPFSFIYALGGWLIALVVGIFILPWGIHFNRN